MDEIRITYGGSNRKIHQHRILINSKFDDAPLGIPVALGSKRHVTSIPDTPENRQWVKDTPGISIKRGQ